MTLLLNEASIAPEAIYDELDRQAYAGGPTILRGNHPHVEKIVKGTRIGVVSISRRHRHLLLEIEQRAGPDFQWVYREYSRNRCEFACPSHISEAAKLALGIAPLSQLVDAPALFGTLTIDSISDGFDNWTIASLDPRWHRF